MADNKDVYDKSKQQSETEQISFWKLYEAEK